MESWTRLKINNWIILSIPNQMNVSFTRAKNLSDYQKAMAVFETSKLIQLKVVLTALETSNCQMVLLMPTWESVLFGWLTYINWYAAKRQWLKAMYLLSTFLGFRCVCGLITSITFQLCCNSWKVITDKLLQVKYVFQMEMLPFSAPTFQKCTQTLVGLSFYVHFQLSDG